MQNCKIHHSVVGLRSCISEGAIIEDSLLMGADYYEVKIKNLVHSVAVSGSGVLYMYMYISMV